MESNLRAPRSTSPDLAGSSRIAAAALGAYAAFGGGISLLGWAINLPRLTDWAGSGVSMFPNTAICALLGGIVLLIISTASSHWSLASTLPAGLMAAIAGLTLLQHFTGANFHIDTFLFDRPWGQRAAAAPMRMGPPASIAFFLIGSSLLMLTHSPGRRTKTLAAALGVGIAAIGMLSITGYFYGAESMYTIPRSTGIAFQTASMVLALGVGIVMNVPDRQPMRVLLDRGTSGYLARRALPLLIVLPLVLGWLRVAAQNARLVDTAFGTAILMLLIIVLLITLLWWALGVVSIHERRVRESSQRLESVMAGINDGFLIIDRDWRYAYFNASFRRTLEAQGHNPAALLGTYLFESFPEFRDTPGAAELRRAMTHRVDVEYEILYEPWRKWFAVRASPTPDGSLALLTQDITERKKIETQRQQILESERAARTAAEQAGQLKDDFLATVSHELRTPLNGILGWAQLLKHTRSDATTITEGIEAIERSARMQGQIINDLLDMNRIVSGKLRLELQTTELAPIIEAALEIVRPSADARNIRIEKMLDNGTGPIKGDPSRLQQVIWNLLSNAVKFTPSGGKVEVHLQCIESHMEISVSDTGRGIKPDFLPHVFERFRQADASSTRQHGGLGLGLAIVKQLVELHGGAVSVSSDGEGKGATFRVQLPMPMTRPLIGTANLSPAETALYNTDLTGLRVLIVDDDPVACNVMRRLLSECQAQVSSVSSGVEALSRIAHSVPDLLLCDIGMPEMDGFEVIRRIRADNVQIPAIAVTAFAHPEDRIRSLRAGFNTHLSKPVEARELLAVINQCRKPSSSRV